MKTSRNKSGLIALKTFKKVRVVFIETITACNLRCSYCPNSIYDRGLLKNKKIMESKLFYKIIDELAAIGWNGEIQPHSYGEPLLDARIFHLIDYTKKKLPKTKINLFTNGEFLNLQLYKKLIISGVNHFTITQHLPMPAKGVVEILDYRNTHGNGGVDVVYSRLDRVYNKGGLVKIKNPEKPDHCLWPTYYIGVAYDGNILACCHDYLNIIKLGNVKNQKLFDIWNDKYYSRLRSEIKNGVFSNELCKNCLGGEPRND